MLAFLLFAATAPVVVVYLLIRSTSNTPIAQVLYDTEQQRSLVRVPVASAGRDRGVR